MSDLFNIVHISQTPLVASPAKIAAAQRLIGHNAIAVALSDYPQQSGLSGKFIDDFMIPDSFVIAVIEQAIIRADIIHIHNDLPAEWAEKLLRLNQTAKYVYQVHSPLREGPLYITRADSIGLPFVAKLVVGQYQPRFYPDYIPVPNIILDTPSIQLRKQGKSLRVMYSPTHKHDGRWNNKCSDILEQVLQSLVRLRKIEVVRPEKPVHPKTLMQVRRTCHVTIDEIVTGGFHQVSIEGLCAGNVVINRADYFAKAIFSQFASQELPPFAYADETTIAETLLRLADDPIETANLQQESYSYFCQYLAPNKLAEFFDAAYKSIA